LGAGRSLIQAFPGNVTQAELSAWLESSATQGKPELSSVLLDGAWRTYPTSLREAGHNITAFLEGDMPTIKRLPAKEWPGYTLPLPSKGSQKWERHKFYPIAPADKWDYSPEIGAFDVTKE